MQLVGKPQALPGSCYHCGSGSREAYIDFNLSIDFHGAFYLCNVCVAEMAALIGYLPPSSVEKIQAANETLGKALEARDERIAALEEIVGGYQRMGLSDISTGIHASAGGDRLYSQDPADGEAGLDDGENGSPEPSDEPGLDELPSNAESEREPLGIEF